MCADLYIAVLVLNISFTSDHNANKHQILARLPNFLTSVVDSVAGDRGHGAWL